MSDSQIKAPSVGELLIMGVSRENFESIDKLFDVFKRPDDTSEIIIDTTGIEGEDMEELSRLVGATPESITDSYLLLYSE